MTWPHDPKMLGVKYRSSTVTCDDPADYVCTGEVRIPEKDEKFLYPPRNPYIYRADRRMPNTQTIVVLRKEDV